MRDTTSFSRVLASWRSELASERWQVITENGDIFAFDEHLISRFWALSSNDWVDDNGMLPRATEAL